MSEGRDTAARMSLQGADDGALVPTRKNPVGNEKGDGIAIPFTTPRPWWTLLSFLQGAAWLIVFVDVPFPEAAHPFGDGGLWVIA